MNLIYFSPVYWQSYEQRPHKMVRYLRRHGFDRVLWVQPYPVRLPHGRDVWRKRAAFDQGTRPPDGVECVSIPALPVEPLPLVREMNRLLRVRAWRRIAAFANRPGKLVIGVGKPSALALLALRRLPRTTSFYDSMDNYPYFYHGLSRAWMARVEARVCEAVDHLWVSSRDIQRRLEKYNPATLLLHNACDVSLIPGPVGSRNEERVIFGYVGSIGHWFDWDWLIQLANAAPDAEFHLAGPVFERPSSPLPANIKLLGAKPHEEALRLMQGFTAGLIPRKVNALTAGMDPIKYYEYSCAGLPVITTAFGEMRYRGREEGVFTIAADEPGRAAILREAAAHRLSRDFVENFRARNDWRARFETARSALVG